MERNKEEHIDIFTRKIIKDAGLEKPSIDFTAMVMAKVETDKVPLPSKPITYEAPISSKGWIAIAITLVIFTIFI